MSRRITYTLVVALIGSVAWACASAGGGSLSSTRYNAEDLAQVQYDNMYDFLRAHSRVRVGQTGAAVPLRVRRTTGGGTSMGGASNAAGGFDTGTDTTFSTGGGASGGGSSSVRGAPQSDRYVQSRLYVDDREVGSPIPFLRQLSPDRVEELEILRPSEASSEYGGSGDVGVVKIILKE